jgi:hypothetical protein
MKLPPSIGDAILAISRNHFVFSRCDRVGASTAQIFTAAVAV